MSVGRLGARVLIGGLFVGHGTQKLFGWFGGPGRAGTEGMMEALKMRPAKVHALDHVGEQFRVRGPLNVPMPIRKAPQRVSGN